MKKAMGRSIGFFLICLLLLCSPQQANAWPCAGVTCGSCETCVDGVCVCKVTSQCGCPGRSCSGCCYCSSCECVPDDSKCGDPVCWDCIGCGCHCVITVNSVSSDKDVVCVGCPITFTASVTGSCSCVDWSGGGDPATASDTCTFSTHWDSPGTKTVTATPDCGSSKSKQVTIVKVDKLQYYDDYTSSYIDMPNPLYVVKDWAVLFKAIPDPADASWPSGKPVWGGTSGASGTGATKSVQFNTLSSNATDYKTVTVTCGNTVTANVIVFDFEGVLTPADNFSGRSQINYGLEEVVNLSYTIDPSDLTATQVGGLKWYKYSGVGTVSGGSDGMGTYDAGASAGNVNLFLRIESGPCRAYNKDYYKTVVAPSGTRMTRYSGNVKHIQGYASAGIALYYWLDPKNVSFKYLTFGEDSAPSTSVSGFYLTCWPWNSYPTGGQVGAHAQNTFGAILGGNSTTGCRVSFKDEAYTGEANPYAAGSFTWSIPTQYIDDTSTRHTFGSNQNHVSTYDATGYATQSKGGQSGSAALNDPNSGW